MLYVAISTIEAAKEKDSRQKEELHGKNEKTHGKRKNLTTKKKPHGKKKRLTAKKITSRQTKYQCPHGIKESV